MKLNKTLTEILEESTQAPGLTTNEKKQLAVYHMIELLIEELGWEFNGYHFPGPDDARINAVIELYGVLGLARKAMRKAWPIDHLHDRLRLVVTPPATDTVN
jgi:hypothetical protein